MRDWLPAAFKLLSFSCLAAAVNGCAGPSNGTKPESSYTPVITEESMLTAARANSDSPIEAAAASGCPPIEVEGGQRSVTIYEGNRVGDGNSIIQRAEITRRCANARPRWAWCRSSTASRDASCLGRRGSPGRLLSGCDAGFRQEPGTRSRPIWSPSPSRSPGKIHFLIPPSSAM